MVGHDIAIESLLRQSQRSRTCYVPVDRTERSGLDAMAKEGTVVSPMPQLYARAEYWRRLPERERALHCMRSIQRMHVDWVFVGMSAGLAWGLEVPEDRAWPIRVASGHGSRHACAALVRQAIPHDEPVLVERLRVTSLGRTVLDCMRELGFEDALVLADSALDAGCLTRDELIRQLSLIRRGDHRDQCALDVARRAEQRVGWAARVHARVVALGCEPPSELDAAWARLDGDELVKALEGAGVTTSERDPKTNSALSIPSLRQP